MAVPARQHATAAAPAGRRSRRVEPRTVATRRHGALNEGPQPLVRATAGLRTGRHLAVVPRPRGRRFAGVAVVVSVVLGLAMMGAAAFQTQLAQRQVELDRLDREIRESKEQYESLRRQRAELRSPARLGEVAAANGMVPAGDSEVREIDADVLAVVAMATGDVDPAVLGNGRSTLDDFREVKAATSRAVTQP